MCLGRDVAHSSHFFLTPILHLLQPKSFAFLWDYTFKGVLSSNPNTYKSKGC